MFERDAKHAAFIRSIPYPWELTYSLNHSVPS